jgi:hypothetical protein
MVSCESLRESVGDAAVVDYHLSSNPVRAFFVRRVGVAGVEGVWGLLRVWVTPSDTISTASQIP